MASVDQKLDALNAKIDSLVALVASMQRGGGSSCKCGSGCNCAAAQGSGPCTCGSSGAAAEPEDDGSSHPSIVAFDELVAGPVSNLYKACAAIEGIKNLGQLAQKAFAELRRVLCATTQCKKPSAEALQKFAAPLFAVSAEASKLVDNRSQFFPHQTSFNEFIGALGWIMVTPTPIGHVQAQLEAADFYLNKILTSQKGADAADHKLFVQSIKATLKEMQPFIKAHHTTGLSWNAKGKELANFGSAAAPSAPAKAPAGPPIAAAGPPIGAGGPPTGPPTGPPMMPPSMPPPSAAPPAAETGAAGMAAVMAAIAAAGDTGITAGLKHVTKDMKTKNLPKSDAPIPAAPTPKAAAPAVPKAAAAGPKPEPKMYESQGKWFVEHFADTQVTIPADQLNVKQNVYIYKCSNALVTVPGKCKAICLDSCAKTNMICTSVVSTIEIVSCKNVGIQVDETAPAIAVDKSASIQLHLSKQAVETRPDIVTSNITAVNVVVPGRQPDDDPIEIPIHEQYMTRFTDSFSVKTTPNDSI